MILNIAQAQQCQGETFEVHLEEMLTDQMFSGRKIVPHEPAVLDVRYRYDANVLRLNGTLRATFEEQCSQCTGDYILSLEIPLEERFLRNAEESDDEAYAFEGNTVDLTDMVWDNIYLNFPIAGVCSETCRGLCPVCGCNLNITQCNCVRETEKETNSNQFQKLLIRQDKEV